MYSNRVRNKISKLLQFFNTIEIEEGERVKLDAATRVIDVKKFINFSQKRLKDVDEVTPITKPYILRLYKLRLYYEQK